MVTVQIINFQITDLQAWAPDIIVEKIKELGPSPVTS
jgi:hypothetical protein